METASLRYGGHRTEGKLKSGWRGWVKLMVAGLAVVTCLSLICHWKCAEQSAEDSNTGTGRALISLRARAQGMVESMDFAHVDSAATETSDCATRGKTYCKECECKDWNTVGTFTKWAPTGTKKMDFAQYCKESVLFRTTYGIPTASCSNYDSYTSKFDTCKDPYPKYYAGTFYCWYGAVDPLGPTKASEYPVPPKYVEPPKSNLEKILSSPLVSAPLGILSVLPGESEEIQLIVKAVKGVNSAISAAKNLLPAGTTTASFNKAVTEWMNQLEAYLNDRFDAVTFTQDMKQFSNNLEMIKIDLETPGSAGTNLESSVSACTTLYSYMVGDWHVKAKALTSGQFCLLCSNVASLHKYNLFSEYADSKMSTMGKSTKRNINTADFLLHNVLQYCASTKDSPYTVRDMISDYAEYRVSSYMPSWSVGEVSKVSYSNILLREDPNTKYNIYKFQFPDYEYYPCPSVGMFQDHNSLYTFYNTAQVMKVMAQSCVSFTQDHFKNITRQPFDDLLDDGLNIYGKGLCPLATCPSIKISNATDSTINGEYTFWTNQGADVCLGLYAYQDSDSTDPQWFSARIIYRNTKHHDKTFDFSSKVGWSVVESGSGALTPLYVPDGWSYDENPYDQYHVNIDLPFINYKTKEREYINVECVGQQQTVTLS